MNIMPGVFRILVATLIVFSNVSSAQQNESGSESGIQVSNRVSRTALFPGDTISYQIEILCSSDVDILTDDLAGDELLLTGLELGPSNFEVEPLADGTRYRFTYNLTTFETGNPDLQIGNLRVRYYFKRPGQRIEDVATVGEVNIPGVDLVLRSTLPGETEDLQLRDVMSTTGHSSSTDSAGIWGIILIIISAFPVGTSLLNYIQKWQRVDMANAAESARLTSGEFDWLRNIDANVIEQRREGFSRLQDIIRNYIERTTGLTSPALTASDLTVKLQLGHQDKNYTELAGILANCEYACYGRDRNLPGANDLIQGVELTEKIVTGN